MIYSNMSLWVCSIFMLVSIVFTVSCFFLKGEPIRDMKSKFESGIDQSEQEYPPFYMHFFYIGVLFLIFDVEIILSIPAIQSTMEEESRTIFWTSFISIIFLGLVLESTIDSIEWKE